MGLIEKAEGFIGLAALAGIAYIILKNWDNLKDMWCKIPGVCSGDTELKVPQNPVTGLCPTGYHVGFIPGLFGIGGKSECVPDIPDSELPDTNIPNINDPILPCNGKPMIYSIEKGLYCPDSVIPVTPVTPYIPSWPGVHYCPEDDSYRGPDALCPSQQIPKTPEVLPVDWCGPENPVGSGCYPEATGSLCNVNCNTRCSDIYGNYKACDDMSGNPGGYIDPYRCNPGVPVDATGYYPDIYGNLMKNCVEVCHRGDTICAHNLPLDAGNWRYVYD